MSHSPFGRRRFLATLSSGAGAAWLAASPELLREVSRAARLSRPEDPWQVLSPAEAVTLDAITAQIFPTTDTPGAREARVVWFIDRSLAAFAAADLPIVRRGVHDIDAVAQRRQPSAQGFADLDPVRQVDVLKAFEAAGSPFFEVVRVATIQGLFANPEYGGNDGKVGWRLIGFEDRFGWQAPFGDYDR